MKLLHIVVHLLVAVGSIGASGTSYIASYNPDDKISAKRAIEAAGGRITKDMAFINSWAVTFNQQATKGVTPKVMSTPEVLALIDLHESITAIEVDHPRKLHQACKPVVSYTSAPGIRDKTQILPYGIRLVQADLVKSNPNNPKKVCIIDSGISIKHPDLCGRADNCTSRITYTPFNTYNRTSSTLGPLSDPLEDRDGHGTHVAGTIAALNNGQGVVGVSGNDVNLHIIKLWGADGERIIAVSDLVLMAYACASAGANIISMSLGGPGISLMEEFAFDIMRTRYNMLSVASAGNSGNSTFEYPAAYDSVLSVGAVDRNSEVAWFSQRNKQVDLVAPGVSIYSTVPSGTLFTPAPSSVCTLMVGNATIFCRGMMARDPGVVYKVPPAFTKPTGLKAAVFDCGNMKPGSICKGAAGKICLMEHNNVNYTESLQVCVARQCHVPMCLESLR